MAKGLIPRWWPESFTICFVSTFSIRPNGRHFLDIESVRYEIFHNYVIGKRFCRASGERFSVAVHTQISVHSRNRSTQIRWCALFAYGEQDRKVFGETLLRFRLIRFAYLSKTNHFNAQNVHHQSHDSTAFAQAVFM